MKVDFNKSKFNLNAILTIAFVVVLLGQAYLGYKYFYGSMVGKDVVVPEGRVVRVQLKSFQETIEYLQGLYEHRPEILVLPRQNPFQ